MKTGTLISLLVAILATGGMVLAFLTNSSPYVTVAQAKEMTRDGLHIVGDMDKSTLENRVREGMVNFQMTDEKGDRIQVRYTGAPISNLGNATRVVVVGKMEGGEFHSNKIIVKCPSKYEGEGAGEYKKAHDAEMPETTTESYN